MKYPPDYLLPNSRTQALKELLRRVDNPQLKASGLRALWMLLLAKLQN